MQRFRPAKKVCILGILCILLLIIVGRIFRSVLWVFLLSG